MFQIERLQVIKQVLREQKSVDVIWLSNYLKVSEVTVRRDLEKLEAEGFLKRTYGGAVLNGDVQQTERTVNTDNGSRLQIGEKNRVLGELCAALVENHDVIFLGRGESSLAIAEYLQGKTGVVIFTNNIGVIDVMRHDQDNMVILTGGKVNYGKELMVNSPFNVPFPDIRVNKAFLCVQGADLEYGLTLNDQDDAAVYQEIKKRTKNKVIIMEGTVFDKIGLIKVDEITDIDYVVTDGGIPDQYKKFFYKNGVRLHQKFDLS
ncbi:DeoR/GlpR family DNA-binding transcription regulator [Blautia schinkii]|nr:DeoR/GlpR family DNA-binding transcription regulator [Blautia schinkii]